MVINRMLVVEGEMQGGRDRARYIGVDARCMQGDDGWMHARTHAADGVGEYGLAGRLGWLAAAWLLGWLLARR